MTGMRVPQGGGFLEKARGMSIDSLRAYTGQTPKQETTVTPPGVTMGGAISAGAGMGMAGYMMAGATKGGMTGPQGAMIGAGVGVLSYLLGG